MSLISQLAEQIKPFIDAAREDITIVPSVQVMILVRDYLVATHDLGRTEASRMAMAITIEVSDQNDVELAADILCQGVDLVILTIMKLAGHYDEDMLLDACRALSVEG